MADQIVTGTVVLGEDFSQHRITGYVTHAYGREGVDPHLDVPLFSHVIGGLYQGGCLDGVELPPGFDYVLSLYPWGRYVLPKGTERREVKMYDALDQAMDQVEEIAQDVAARLEDGQTVLVHCQAGCNRSGLVAGRVLMLMGYSADDAITLLRDARSPLVLCNQTFENYLRGLDREPPQRQVYAEW
jgi:hypothetical protein